MSLILQRFLRKKRKQIPDQIAMYHRYNDLVREGDYYRILSFRENNRDDSYMVVSKDKKEALVTFVQVMHMTSVPNLPVKLEGLDPDAMYRIDEIDMTLSGSVLMNAGLPVKWEHGDYKAGLYYLKAVE